MGPVPWNESLATGCREVDDEHKGLFDALARLEALAAKGGPQTDGGALLRTFAGAASEHFSSEEAAMSRVKYPGAALHAMKHMYLKEQARGMLARFERGNYALDAHSVRFLSYWLVTHVQNEDRNFGLWYNEHCKK